MTITLSQQDYWDLVYSMDETDALSNQHEQQPESQKTDSQSADHDTTWRSHNPLRKGYYREIQIRDGLDLAIADECFHTDLIITSCDRDHPLELNYTLVGVESSNLNSTHAGQHAFYGSGMAPGEALNVVANQRSLCISIHIEPALFCQWAAGSPEQLPDQIRHWVKPSDQIYYIQVSKTTTAMQTALQQILQCPFQGLTQRLYLESKVWELMALQLAHTLEPEGANPKAKPLKPEDVERIHYAKEVLVARLDQPPSLIELARLVGINDCKLKVGFRQVFGTTVFSYLHDCRMTRSRQLLDAGELTVAEAAKAVGFANRSHFAIAFRKKFGVNPRTYRQEMLNSCRVG
ncbi:helix-turn-helix transcriptional regulator [Myxacorys almedinensis]|uniref:Helix-turn-helix domain-containing protein n=1 Tax=Myxacorys almedinensis A TaxID=2690445 RepID=A0A8J7Z1B2_9CYAN|nr:AraC family transcriptional regulator [Myxacorys almedinensis]NDJ17350.1 helix-turn-helix domain-containing protein [Myxacorys almedinensis A]